MCRKIVIGLASLGAAGLVITTTALAKIVGSIHDLKEASWNTTGEICIVCHTPHKAMNDDTITNKIMPLWNHTVTKAEYKVYDKTNSPSLNADVGQPSPASKICLSCHDGTVALGAFGGQKDEYKKTKMSDSPWIFTNLSTDLRNDHPISFTYDAQLASADGWLFNPTQTTVPTLNGKSIDEIMLVEHKLECGSCHDVHADKGDSKIVGNHLLLIHNRASALCLTCHNK